MKNKKAREMICNLLVSNTDAVCAWFSDEFLCAQAPSEDEYCSYDDIRIRQGVVSLTSDDLIKLQGGRLSAKAKKWLNKKARTTHGRANSSIGYDSSFQVITGAQLKGNE